MPRVPRLELVIGGSPAASIEAFEVAFADDDGERRLELTAALTVPFESCHTARCLGTRPACSTARSDPPLVLRSRVAG